MTSYSLVHSGGKPKTLNDMAYWAQEEAQSSELQPPLRLHAHDYAKDDHPGRTRTLPGSNQIIVGPPYTEAFRKYLDGQKPNTPIRRALWKMRAAGRQPQSFEFRICFAIVEGGYGLGELEDLFRCSRTYLDAAARRGLDLLYSLSELEKASGQVGQT